MHAQEKKKSHTLSTEPGRYPSELCIFDYKVKGVPLQLRDLETQPSPTDPSEHHQWLHVLSGMMHGEGHSISTKNL